MRPLTPELLEIVLARIEELLASSADPELSVDLARMARVLRAVAVEYDDCVIRRADEIRCLHDLLTRAARVSGGHFEAPDDDALADLRISSLEARLDALREQSIGVQAWLEEQTDPAAASLLADLLRLQRSSALRRVGILQRR